CCGAPLNLDVRLQSDTPTIAQTPSRADVVPRTEVRVIMVFCGPSIYDGRGKGGDVVNEITPGFRHIAKIWWAYFWRQAALTLAVRFVLAFLVSVFGSAAG